MSQNAIKARGSIARRLIIGAGIWSAVLLIAGAIILSSQYRDAVHRVDDDRFTAVLDSLAVYAETNPQGEVYLSRTPGDPRFERAFSGHYWQISKLLEGRAEILLRSQSLFDAELEIPVSVLQDADEQRGAGFKQSLTGPLDEPMRSLSKAYELSDNETVLIVSAAADRRPGDIEIARFRFAVIGVLGMFGIGLLVGIFFQVRFGLQPLYKLENEIKLVREGELEQISGEYPKELTPLSQGLNTLLAHNKEIVTRARTHVGNLAHALKTPISVLRNETRNKETPLARLVGRQSDIMSRQVDHHLRRASAAARAQALGARTPVAQTVDDLLRTMRRLFVSRELEISTNKIENSWFRGEKQDLEELLGNLLENACKWAAGKVRVTAHIEDDVRLILCVEDDGPGLSGEEKAQVIKRGERLDEAAPGSGLGLSIVSDLAKAYGGELLLRDSKMGGLQARLELPASTGISPT